MDYAYYARTSDIPSDFNAYSIFAYTWANTDTSLALTLKFFLFDLKSGSKNGLSATTTTPDVGFPRD